MGYQRRHERGFVVSDDLDVISNPVMVQRVCLHKNRINSCALEVIGETVYDTIPGAFRDENGRLTVDWTKMQLFLLHLQCQMILIEADALHGWPSVRRNC
jgi:predicted amidohydrolase YtcJ